MTAVVTREKNKIKHVDGKRLKHKTQNTTGLKSYQQRQSCDGYEFIN